jgi:hypothetical protein
MNIYDAVREREVVYTKIGDIVKHGLPNGYVIKYLHSKITWDAAWFTPKGNIQLSRVVRQGGKPLAMGLNYKQKVTLQ